MFQPKKFSTAILTLMSLTTTLQPAFAQQARERQTPPTLEEQFSTYLRRPVQRMLTNTGENAAVNVQLVAPLLADNQNLSQPICKAEVQPTTDMSQWFPIAQIQAVNHAANLHLPNCSAAQASALLSAVQPGQCAVFMLADSAAAAQRADADIKLEGFSVVVEDQTTDSASLVMGCNRTQAPIIPQVLGRIFRNTGNANVVITRVNLPVSQIVSFGGQYFATAPAPTAEVSAAALGRLNNALVNRSENPILSGLDLTGVAVDQVAFCQANFGALSNIGQLESLTVVARSGDHSCSAEQATAFSRPVAPHTCAVMAQQAFDPATTSNIATGFDEDHVKGDIGTRGAAATLVICNSSDEAKPLIIKSTRYTNEPSALVARFDIEARDNGHGLTVEAAAVRAAEDAERARALAEKERLAAEEAANPTAARPRTQQPASYYDDEEYAEEEDEATNDPMGSYLEGLSEVADILTGLGEQPNLRNQAICSSRVAAANGNFAAITSTPRGERGQPNICTQLQATAITAALRPNQCAIFAGYAVDGVGSLDLKVLGNNATPSPGDNIDSEQGNPYSWVLMCNTTRANMRIQLQAKSTTATDLFISRFTFTPPAQ